jgi:hypothetical protein
VNAVTGSTHARFPLSPWKIAFVTLLVILVIVIIVAVVGQR